MFIKELSAIIEAKKGEPKALDAIRKGTSKYRELKTLASLKALQGAEEKLEKEIPNVTEAKKPANPSLN